MNINKIDEIVAANVIENNGVSVIKVTYSDGTYDNIPYNESLAIELKKCAEINKIKAETKAKIEAVSKKDEIVPIKGTEKTLIETTGVAKNNDEKETEKKSSGWGYVLAAGVAIGTLAMGLKGCADKMLDGNDIKPVEKPIERTIEETNTDTIDADMKNTYISYEDFVALVDKMDSEVDKVLGMDIDKESYSAYLVISNLDNLEQDTIDRLIATYNLPTNGQDLVVKALPVFDNIAQQNYNYMNNLENTRIRYSQYIVDDDDKPLLDQIDDIVEEVRELDSKYDNNKLTDADKARAIQIYEALDSYLRSQNKGPIDNRNNYNEGAAKVADFSIPTIEGVLAYDRFIDQNQVNAHTGSHIDPSDGEKMLNTSIHDWATIIKLWEKCGNMVAEIVKENTQTYGGLTAEEVQAYRAAYAQEQAPTTAEQQMVRRRF